MVCAVFSLWFAVLPKTSSSQHHRPHENPFSLKTQALTQGCGKEKHAGEERSAPVHCRGHAGHKRPPRYLCSGTKPSSMFRHGPAPASQLSAWHRRLLLRATAVWSPRPAPRLRGWREAGSSGPLLHPGRGPSLPRGALARPALPSPGIAAPGSRMAADTASSARTKHGRARPYGGTARVQDGAGPRCCVRTGSKMAASPPPRFAARIQDAFLHAFNVACFRPGRPSTPRWRLPSSKMAVGSAPGY